MQKIISFIIPTYNAAKYLDKCLSSFIIGDILKQNMIEVLVINDGSSDDSADVAENYVNKYPDVFRIINKNNGGHGSTINTGIMYARGKFFKVIDADDWIENINLLEFLEKLIIAECDAVITSYYTYDINNNQKVLKDIYFNCESIKDNYCDLKYVNDNWSKVEWGMTFHGITYNTEYYKNQDYALCEGVFYEDQEYATIPMCNARNLLLLNLPIYVYRIGDINQSVSIQNRVNRLSHQEVVIRKCLNQYVKIINNTEEQKKYWCNKVSRMLTTYYQIALLINPNKRLGRNKVRVFHDTIRDNKSHIMHMVRKKYYVFVVLNYLHISSDTYDKFWMYIKKFLSISK